MLISIVVIWPGNHSSSSLGALFSLDNIPCLLPYSVIRVALVMSLCYDSCGERKRYEENDKKRGNKSNLVYSCDVRREEKWDSALQ